MRKQQAAEHTIVFAVFMLSLLKWLILSAVTGAAGGAAVAAFLFILDYFCGVATGFDYYFVLMPAAFFLSAFLIRVLAPDAEGHGTEKAIKAIHENNGRMRLKVIPVKLVTTVITVSCGGSAGKEGPSTQIGAGVSSVLSGLFRLNSADSKRMAVCGISAAFAAVFGTPVAAAVFALEVLVIGRMRLKNLYPAFIAAIIGCLTAQALGVENEAFHIFVPDYFGAGAGAQLLILLETFLAGIAFGLVAFLMCTVQKYAERLSGSIKIYPPLKGLIGGGALVILVLLFGASGRNYTGMGIPYFTSVIEGSPANYYDFLLKIVFTCITLSFGGSGGILTPLLFIGITAGSALAQLFGLDLSFFAALGMLAVLAGATNTPLACTIMGIEMFGAEFGVAAAVACCVAYIVSGHRSVYPSQKLGASKVTSVRSLLEADIEHAEAYEEVRYGRLLTYLLSKIKKPTDAESAAASSLPGGDTATDSAVTAENAALPSAQRGTAAAHTVDEYAAPPIEPHIGNDEGGY